MATTLSLFWNLSSASKKERISSTVKLVNSLEKFQGQHAPKVSPGSEDDEENVGSTDGLDVLNAHDVAYSIRRLIRGLASPRESSRLGFSVALTELLSRLDTVTSAQVISIIVDGSKIQGSMTGQEERDILFARLFGLATVIHSGLLVRQTPLSTSPSSATNSSSLESYKELVDHLLILAEKKSWLRECAWWTIGQAIDAVIKSSVSWKEEALASTLEVVYERDKDICTPEAVAITLKLQPAMPKHDWKTTLAPTFKNSDILAPANFASLGRILKETPGEDEWQQSNTGTWKAQLHYVWNIIFDSLLPESEPGRRRSAVFQEFFRVVVDETLFGASSSPERKFWGFLVFKKALRRVDGADLPMLFTKNFMRSWINHLSQKDRHLHKISQDVVKDIQNFVQQNPDLGFTLILQLTGIHGSQQFDKLTRTKTVESILSKMDGDGIMKYIQSLLEQMDESDNDIVAEENKKIWIADQFAALVRNGAIPKREDWIQLILNWFAVQGLYVVKRKSAKGLLAALHVTPSNLPSEDFRRICRGKLLGCLADLTPPPTASPKGDKAPKEGTKVDDESWISKIFTVVNQLDKDSKHVTPLSEPSQEEQLLLQQAHKIIDNLRQVDGETREAAKGVELLLSASLLHRRCANLDDNEPDAGTLETCLAAAATMFSTDNSSKKRRKSQTISQPESPKPIDMLVDVLIGFLEKSTSYLRAVANKTFSCIASAATETTIDLIVAQLERRNPADLVADEEDEIESATSEGSDEDAESSDEDDESEFDDDDEAALELRMKIEDALKANGVEAAIGDTDEESDEELADDEQMMAIDEHLAEVFRSRSGDSKQSKNVNAQREATHFKNRVLDLVDIFTRKMPQSPHNLRLVLPLIELATKSGNDERQLSDKARGILNNRLAKLKDPLQEVDQEYAETILDELHIRARKAHSSDALATLSNCSLFICRVSTNTSREKSVLRLYRESIVDFITRKASSLNITFFKDFITRYPALGWCLRDDILDTSSKAINVYRKCQAFQLLNVILTLSTSAGDPQDVLSFILKLHTAVLHFIDSACDDQVSLSAAQIKDLFKLVMVGVRQASKVDNSNQNVWDSGPWHALHGRLVASKRFGSSIAVLKLCSQVESALQAQHGRQHNVIAPKRKVEEVEAEGVSSATKRKKKKSVSTSQS
ncbi:DNA polymerase phi-domain-containing protein [Suillus clintonianus]|uniref:DNA polymerase phi-domain-containing protein n=1 Tax=Suillus clintonianus TaxID=1904413 RepID=UPI001B8611B9|nr:DNA polymerase phi-domain-containing protein [Suillus clintonianus]KAG2157394.1 DNA polymerase phi-domain-containing protein [Suillus clintonianus]